MRERLMTKSNATRMIATTAIMVLIAGPAAMAQTGTGSSGSNQARPIPQAPVGHRQPRQQDLPPSVLRDEKDPGAARDEKATTGQRSIDRSLTICRNC